MNYSKIEMNKSIFTFASFRLHFEIRLRTSLQKDLMDLEQH